MTVISKSKLKAHMLQIFREIEASGEDVIVTDRGRQVLRIQAITAKRNVKDVFADLQGRIAYHEDINTPTIDEWSEV